jgi:hypothetical protein
LYEILSSVTNGKTSQGLDVKERTPNHHFLALCLCQLTKLENQRDVGVGAVLWIRDILERIHESRSCYFRQWLTSSQQKISFFPKFLAYFFVEVHLHQSSKTKSQKEVTKK